MGFELVDYMFENIIDIPINLKLYLIIVFVIILICICLHIRRELHTPEEITVWFIGLILLNVVNVTLTILHYKYKQGSFKGDQGAPGDTGIPGDRGENKKCNSCEDKIGINLMDTFDDLQTIYLNNNPVTIKRPTLKIGYHPIGYTISGKNKKGYTLSGSTLKNPLDYILIVKIPAISGKTNTPTFIWRAIPPTDYVALGDIVTTTETKPLKNAIMCVPFSCVREVETNGKSWTFNYQDNKTYIYSSLWDTPLNTFYCNYVSDEFSNGTVYDNITSNTEYRTNLITLFNNTKSPFDLMGYAQNINNSLKDDEINLMTAINHYFPSGFDYKISVDNIGDINGGGRLNEIQLRILKYAKTLSPPNIKMYTLDNNCLSTDDMNEVKQTQISKILKLYDEINLLIAKYPNNKSIKIYLHSQYDNISKSIQNIPNFEQKLSEADFNDFSIERLNILYDNVNKYYMAILKMTSEKSFERVELILNAVTAIKRYNITKTNYDNIASKKCKTQDETKTEFQLIWNNIDSLFIGYKNYKEDLKRLMFDNITDSKLNKTISYLNDLSDILDIGIKNC